MFFKRKSGISPVDEERSQSRARLMMCLASLVGFTLISFNRNLGQSETLVHCFRTIIAYLLYSIAWLFFVTKTPGKFQYRRYFTMFTDVGIMTFFLHLGDEHVTTYYPIFLWIIIGNGIRFGRLFLSVGVVMGTLGFGSLLLFNEYWRENSGLGIGLLLGVIVLPVFFMTVLQRLRTVNRLEIELAKSKLADRAKDRFLATMSHELRTPMNGVLGMAELLQDSDLDQEQRGHVQVITRSVDSLLNIINDILDYSKITANSLTLETVPFDLKEVLEDVYLLLGATAANRGIELLFDYPEDQHRGFLGDPTRVRQIALNVVGNAIKFTHEGNVKLICKVVPDCDNQNVILKIVDTGIGIAKDRLDKIFNEFEQVDNSVTRQYGGTGLGLSISRQLAGLMGGEIRVDSKVGAGSTFTIGINLLECELPEAKQEVQLEELPQYGFHALVVEDNLFNQLVTRKLLMKLDITADVAENGAVAVDLINDNHYDVVFMDVRMPVMNGYIATKQIRGRQDELADLPIIALTAETTVQAAERCLAAGMDYHLAKPVGIGALVEAIESVERLVELAAEPVGAPGNDETYDIGE
ncbi:MAG: ATP-binding protein [bacterium]